jgi:methylenetetrahydrofolate reductase (NADPH)
VKTSTPSAVVFAGGSALRTTTANAYVADFGVTQFFCTTEYYTRMADELAELGCDTPVVPGVMPATSVPGLVRMAGMNGTELPEAMMDRLHAVEDQPDEVRKVGVEVATRLSQELMDAGAPGLHLYALNRSASVTEIVNNLGWASASG